MCLCWTRVDAKNSIQGHTTAGTGYLQPFLREGHRRILRFALTTIIVACESILLIFLCWFRCDCAIFFGYSPVWIELTYLGGSPSPPSLGLLKSKLWGVAPAMS